MYGDFYSSIFFFIINHCVMTEGKLREGGKGIMSRDLSLTYFSQIHECNLIHRCMLHQHGC